MKPHHAKPRIGGFTIIEVLVCVVVLFVLVGLYLPTLAHRGTKSNRITCASNLKQISLAFRMWSNDHGEKFPWEVTSKGNSDGTKEFAMTGDVWRHFQAVSNELNSPKVLVCGKDEERTRIADFAAIDNSHLSYFIGLDANSSQPQTILSGDRNLAISNKLLTGVVTLSTKTSLEWTTSIHNKNGNIALADGSASQASTYTLNPQLQAAFNSSTQSTLQFVFPQ